MKEQFKIYIDRLRDGKREEFSFSISHDFMGVCENELRIVGDLNAEGSAYTTDDYLIIQLNLSLKAELPCSICNEPVAYEIAIEDFYHAEPLEEIRGAVFDYSDLVREALLLEVPAFIECEGKCPQRSQIENFLSKEENVPEVKEYFPFESL